MTTTTEEIQDTEFEEPEENTEEEEFAEEEPGNELATLDDDDVAEGEIVEPLDAKQAKALDKKIRTTSDRVSNNFNTLLELLEQALIGQIHIGLEYPSWTAWMKDAVQLQVSDRFERKELAKLLSGKGMSQRAIATTLGVSQKTVDRDLEGEEFDTDTVTTTDGKTAPRNKPKQKEEPEAEPPSAKVPTVGEDFRTEVYTLMNCAEALKDIILEDERFTKARSRIAKSKATDDFREAINELDDLLTAVIGEDVEA